VSRSARVKEGHLFSTVLIEARSTRRTYVPERGRGELLKGGASTMARMLLAAEVFPDLICLMSVAADPAPTSCLG
jgi:hypothetical protein